MIEYPWSSGKALDKVFKDLLPLMIFISLRFIALLTSLIDKLRTQNTIPKARTCRIILAYRS
jgi:hypothetical protein